MAKNAEHTKMRKFLEFTNAIIGGKIQKKLIIQVDARMRNENHRVAGELMRKRLKASRVVLKGYHGNRIPKRCP